MLNFIILIGFVHGLTNLLIFHAYLHLFMNANACNHLLYKLQMIGLMYKTLYHGNDHQVG